MGKNKSLTPLADVWTTRFGLPELWKTLSTEEMKVEEFRENGSMVVRAELPGVDPDKDVEVMVEDGVLRIHAERSQETKHEDAKGYRSEFRYGSFTRQLRLPPGATEKDVKATYRDGILEVRVPLDESKAEAQKIPIARS